MSLELYLKNKAEAERASNIIRNDMFEEEIAYQMIIPQYEDDGKTLVKDVEYYNRSEIISTYMTSDYQTTIDEYAENMFHKLPTVRMNAAEGVMKIEDSSAINNVFRKISLLSDIPRSILSIMRTGIRKGICVAELVPEEITVEGFINESGKDVPFKTPSEITMKLIKYDPYSTYIDPKADPDDVRGTAEYCIVDMGLFSMEQLKKIATQNSWKIDYEKIGTEKQEDVFRFQTKELEGFVQEQGVKISKMFTSDGMVTVVINDSYALPPKINSKKVKRMPLIFYSSIPGSSSPYGKMLWNMMKTPVISKSVMASVILDAVGKNYSSPIGTRNKQLAGRRISDFGKDEFIYIPGDSNIPIGNEIYQFKYTDLTQGAMFAVELFSHDIQKISKLSGLAFGVQDKTIRTDGIAQQLQQPALDKKSFMVKQFEQTFLTPLISDFWWILLSEYDKFNISDKIDREKLKMVSSIVCVNGSTLEQDQMTQIDILNFALSYIQRFADSNYNVDSILDALFDQIGWVDAERYKLSPQESLSKMLVLHYGLDPQAAVQFSQQAIGNIENTIQKGQVQ